MAFPPPAFPVVREDWSDADFDMPDDAQLHSASDIDDEDWEIEALPACKAPTAKIALLPPPPKLPGVGEDEEGEGISTIKVAAVPKFRQENEFESDFILPSDMSQLSLRPLSVHTKSSIEFEREQASSSTASSDAYTSLGFGLAASPSSNSTSAASCSDEDNDDDDDRCMDQVEDETDGLVIPTDLFESEHASKRLFNILEQRKHVKRLSAQDDNDFESGFVLNDDQDLAPSRLLSSHKRKVPYLHRTPSMPMKGSSKTGLPSFLHDRPKSPSYPIPSRPSAIVSKPLSSRYLAIPSSSTSGHSPQQSPNVGPPLDPSPSPSLSPPVKPILRNQTSLSGLKPATLHSSAHRNKVTRRPSLSSLIVDSSGAAEPSGCSSSSSSSTRRDFPFARYELSTISSRARFNSHTSMTTREPLIPPTRPSTPSRNPAALRLTMPASSRTKIRPTVLSVFPGAGPRPPSRQQLSQLPRPMSSAQGLPRILRKPKRPHTYGDGTELDSIADLPTDRDQELRYRVAPKGLGNRVPGGSFSKPTDTGTMRRKVSHSDASRPNPRPRTPRSSSSRADIPFVRVPSSAASRRRKTAGSPTTQVRRRPTLIRQIGGTGISRIIGDMRWNPSALRWDGNEQVLREFDAATKTSSRPALITQLTGSSMGSPVGTFGAGARVVGNMMFDPVRMSWLSVLPPEDDEPDVFADLADADDEGDGWEDKAATIRANAGVQPSTRFDAVSSRHSRSLSETESERGSRASLLADIDDNFCERCRQAENRHRAEMKGWLTSRGSTSRDNRTDLYDIRALATRRY